MSGVDLRSPFPGAGVVMRWPGLDGETVEATAQSYRDSGSFRVYTLAVAGDDVRWTGVADHDPDSGQITMVVSRPQGELQRVQPEVGHG